MSAQVVRLRGVGEFVDQAFRYLRKNSLTLVGIQAVVVIPFLLIYWAILWRAVEMIDSSETFPATLVFAIALVWILFSWTTAALVTASGRLVMYGETITWREAYRRSLRYIPKVLGIFLLTGLVTTAGALLFVIPGFIFFIWFSLALYAGVLEDLGVFRAMGRSYRLVRGRAWTVFGYFLLVWLIGIIFLYFTSFVIGIILQPLIYSGSVSGSIILLSILDVFVSLVATAFTTLSGAVLYWQMRIRHDGLDMQLDESSPLGAGLPT